MSSDVRPESGRRGMQRIGAHHEPLVQPAAIHLMPVSVAATPSPPLSSIMQRATANPGSLSRADVAALQRTMGNGAVRQLMTQAQPSENNTGLPGQLKAGVESLSGLAMNDVRVHYNSSRPAQVQAHAYTQGTDIHVAPGQERHLPHEAWHVVQQKQGRVAPTFQMKGVEINDDDALEREADVMGRRAQATSPDGAGKEQPSSSSRVVQRAVGFEFQTANPLFAEDQTLGAPKNVAFMTGAGWKAVPDEGTVEFVTEPTDETPQGFGQMQGIMNDLTTFATAMETVLEEVRVDQGRYFFDFISKKHDKKETDMADHPSTGNRAIATVGYLAKGLATAITPGMWIMQSSNRKVEAAPQVTGGIRLEKIPTAVDAIADPYDSSLRRISDVRRDAETDELVRSVTLARNAAARFQQDHAEPLNERFIGFLSLLIAYLRVPVLVARYTGKPAEYPKDMPLLSRTHFGALAMSVADRKEEWDFLQNPRRLWAAAQLAGSIDDPIFPHGYQTSQGIELGPTRKAFLTGVGKGQDMFAGSTDPGQAAMGSMDMGTVAADPNSKQARDRAILEFRRLPKPVPVSRWSTIADDLFTRIRQINS